MFHASIPSARHDHKRSCNSVGRRLPAATFQMGLNFLLIAILSSLLSLNSWALAFSTPVITRSAIGNNIQHYLRPRSSLYSSLDSSGEHDNGDDGGVVSVTIKRTLPDATPYEARNAWIEYHWKKGGGLPIAISANDQNPDAAKDESAEATSSDGDKKMMVLDRTILPVFMKEKVEYDNNLLVGAKSLDLNYKVTEAGPFFADLIPGSHSAAVTFDATEDEGPGCVMTWNVNFSTTRLASIYDTVTQLTVGTAATTVQEASSKPRLFSATTKIDTSIDPASARAQCLDFVFGRGGGLPLLPPIPYGDVLPEGGGSARQNLLRIPPLITESIIGTKTIDGGVEFTYQLNDSGWLAFPFLLHTHIGRARFTSSESSDDLVIDWDVEMRPYDKLSPLVEKLTEMTVSSLLRNIRVLLTEPDAVVTVKPPRGNSDMLMGQKSFGTVSKESWLGGVLDAHLSDTRSTAEQTSSLFQPWSWGRSGTGDESDSVQFQWGDGYKITN